MVVSHTPKALLVSIHAPREGCDLNLTTIGAVKAVSIHAPREGCDLSPMCLTTLRRCFNSRTPGGVRLIYANILMLNYMFQFTHPGRGATDDGSGGNQPHHSFNSRTPGGVRQEQIDRLLGIIEFQFTHPGRGATTWYRNFS